jgi:hypothetical protein
MDLVDCGRDPRGPLGQRELTGSGVRVGDRPVAAQLEAGVLEHHGRRALDVVQAGQHAGRVLGQRDAHLLAVDHRDELGRALGLGVAAGGAVGDGHEPRPVAGREGRVAVCRGHGLVERGDELDGPDVDIGVAAGRQLEPDLPSRLEQAGPPQRRLQRGRSSGAGPVAGRRVVPGRPAAHRGPAEQRTEDCGHEPSHHPAKRS